MTEKLFFDDAYMQEADGVVTASDGEGVTLDRTIFYATGGGQPGDSGTLDWDGGRARVTEARKGEAGTIRLVLAEGETPPEPSTRVTQRLDWDRRLSHMKVHTALHLLSVVIPLPVSGGQISEGKGRLDFDMPDAPEDKAAIEDALNELVARDLPVDAGEITEAALDADPGLVKTMSVAPPRGSGTIRTIAIGTGDDRIDLQPCGGTHIARTGEIGRLRVGKIEKKGARNRRVYVHLDA